MALKIKTLRRLHIFDVFNGFNALVNLCFYFVGNPMFIVNAFGKQQRNVGNQSEERKHKNKNPTQHKEGETDWNEQAKSNGIQNVFDDRKLFIHSL